MPSTVAVKLLVCSLVAFMAFKSVCLLFSLVCRVLTFNDFVETFNKS